MWPFYSMSKAALDHWSMDAAVRYAEKGVRVNTVSPGPIRTEFLTRHGITGNAYDEARLSVYLMTSAKIV